MSYLGDDHQRRIDNARALDRAYHALADAWDRTGDERVLHEAEMAARAHRRADREVMDEGGYW